ncbi:hypothetical protein KEM54_000451 [Ascosphaera aggregata]|nr:hypothetical protein KEM54_000451 [Ascosphaera aggregata]
MTHNSNLTSIPPSEETQSDLSPVDFTTLGMFIIDDIEFDEPRRMINDVIGGAASFAACGARMVAGKEYGQRVSWIVDAGTDFPDSIRESLESWNTAIAFRENADRLTTRAWNGYSKDTDEERHFKYITPKKRLVVSDLSEPQVMSKGFHIICYAARAITIVKEVLQRRKEIIRRRKLGDSIPPPVFVWEPVPDRCIPEERAAIEEACRYVDVLSPNELELATLLFGKNSWSPDNSADLSEARKLLDSGIGRDGKGLLVVRMGKHGCCVLSKEHCSRLPAYQYPRVIDPTGGGNTFLGGFIQALVTPDRSPVSDAILQMKDAENWADIKDAWDGRLEVPAAAACGTIAASFCIEQIGTPIPCRDDGGETWNGQLFMDRLQKYIRTRAMTSQ